MKGFICSTPYHLLLAINKSLNDLKDEEKALVVFNRFPSCETVVSRLKELKIFDSITVLDTHELDQWNNWNRRFRMFYFYNDFRRLTQKSSFDEIIFFSPDLLNTTFIIKLVLQYSPNCKFSFAEDGIGSYIDESMYKPSDRVEFWLSFFGRKKYVNRIQTLYVNQPELISYNTALNIQPFLQNDENESEYRTIISEIWKEKESQVNHLLFLQQPFYEDERYVLAEAQEYIFKHLQEKYGDELSIRIHPRTKQKIYFSLSNAVGKNDLFEVSSLFRSESTVLIGTNSTALFTPFLLWRKKNPIILLYKLGNEEGLSIAMDLFLRKYEIIFTRLGGNIFIPESLEELHSILDNLVKM